MKRQKAPDLDRKQVVAAGFAVMDDAGLEGLNMRRVAALLGVQAPALYWHVDGKAALLGLMASDVYAMAYAAVPDAPDWREWLRRFGRALRISFARHRDGARLCAIATPAYGDPVAQAARIAAPLVGLGITQPSALLFQAAVISYALGWGIYEANGPMHAFLDQILVFDDGFDIGLEAIVAGLKA